MKPEHQDLLRDLFRDEAADRQREAVLRAGGRRLQRRRRLRLVLRSLGAVAAAAAAVVALVGVPRQIGLRPTPAPALAEHVPASAPAAAAVKHLTDDELLAQFPGTPVALGTLPNGRKILIFPRPGDEARFIDRRAPTMPL